MSSKQDHITQWKHNREFAASIDTKFHDWVVTAVFYTAVHSIDTLLAHDKITVRSHDMRRQALEQTNRYKLISEKFDTLYSLCRTIRYLANPSGWVPADRLQKDVVERYLYPIEKSVQKLINHDMQLGLLVLKTPPSSDFPNQAKPKI